MDDLMLFDFSIYHASDAILGHISLSIEVYRSSWICMITLIYKMHVELMIYCYLIMISQWSLFESFGQAHTFWYCHDSLIELSQAHRLPYHHFSGIHTRSLIHPHRVILESPRWTDMPMLSKLWMVWLFDTEVIGLIHLVTCMPGCIDCYTGAYSPPYHFFFLLSRWLISHLACMAFFAGHNFDDFVGTSLQGSMTFDFWSFQYLWLLKRSLCWGNDSFPSGLLLLRLPSGVAILWTQVFHMHPHSMTRLTFYLFVENLSFWKRLGVITYFCFIFLKGKTK